MPDTAHLLDADRQRPRHYTARFGGRNAVPSVPSSASPRRTASRTPTSPGQNRRFHRTQKRWLANNPPVTLPDLQAQLDRFTLVYNAQRPPAHSIVEPQPPRTQLSRKPHQPRPTTRWNTTGCATTASTPGAKSASAAQTACITSASATHHRGQRILAIADTDTVTVIKLETAEILSTHPSAHPVLLAQHTRPRADGPGFLS